MPWTAMEELIEMFPVIKMAVNWKGDLCVHGTKFMNLIIVNAAGHMKSTCDKVIHSRITYFMHA